MSKRPSGNRRADYWASEASKDELRSSRKIIRSQMSASTRSLAKLSYELCHLIPVLSRGVNSFAQKRVNKACDSLHILDSFNILDWKFERRLGCAQAITLIGLHFLLLFVSRSTLLEGADLGKLTLSRLASQHPPTRLSRPTCPDCSMQVVSRLSVRSDPDEFGQ